MLKNRVLKLIEENQKNLEIYKEEMDYIQKNPDISIENVTLIEDNSTSRFSGAYIERSDKETESWIATESFAFLNQPIEYFKKYKNEFIYVESKWFELIGVDAVSIESDDVFGTYDVMLGLKLQKKFESEIKSFLRKNLTGNPSTFDLIFSTEDGLWNLNFALNNVVGFNEKMSLEEAYQLIYHFLFQLAEALEKRK